MLFTERRPLAEPQEDTSRLSNPEPAAGVTNRASAQVSRHRRRRWPFVVAAAILLVVLAGVSFELALPSVSNAPSRVRAMLRFHHGTMDGLPLPVKLADAVVAVEDEHFYSNVFLNVFDGAARAGLATLRRGGDPGGSTIAQQLAKILYPHGAGLGGILEEIGLGVKLSLTFSKQQILDMYLNAVYYGNGYWGEAAAARGYFGVSPRQMSWAEASMLAGLPQAPSAYDPVRHFGLAKQRQRHVLNQLVSNHLLTRNAADAAYRAPLVLRVHSVTR